MIKQIESSQSSALHSSSASINPVGHCLSWSWLLLFIGGWLGGLLFGVFLNSSGLPDYELAVEGEAAPSALTLDPMRYLSIALLPKESTANLPHLCAFTAEGASLYRWPVPYRLSHNGTLFISGEVRDLLPRPLRERRAVRELVFLVSENISLCLPSLAEAMQALARLTGAASSQRISSWLGVQMLRQPIELRP